MKKDCGLTVAASAGFCPGVKIAIEKALEVAALSKGPVYTLGPLIHNRQVIEELENKGIRAVGDTSELAEKTGVVIIRAHGVTPECEARLRASNCAVVDATCPLVKKAQADIAAFATRGYSTVIAGDKDHAEVIGLLGYAEGRGFVAADSAEALRLPEFDKVNVVSQTTQEEDIFLAVAKAVKGRAAVCRVSNTICAPTRERQKEAIAIARVSDLMIIAGGKHSANTTRLAKLCSKLCPVLHIEKEDELDRDTIKNACRIGLTAGASTPDYLIKKISARILQLTGQ